MRVSVNELTNVASVAADVAGSVSLAKLWAQEVGGARRGNEIIGGAEFEGEWR